MLLFGRRLRREDGMGLAEVIVSAAVLAIVVLGVYAGLDGPSALSGDNRARTIAASLAEQDQERMRAFRTVDLSNLSSKRTVTVSGVPYTVESRSVWTSDASGTESCSSNSTQADYLKVTSTVSWPALNGRPPVKLTSVVAPPRGGLGTNGNLVVQVLDDKGAAVTGMPIAVSPGAASVPTNDFGCSVFGHIPAGGYQARFGQPGYVDRAGNANVVLSGTVTSGATTTLSTSYARSASVVASFDTKVGSATKAAQARSLTVSSAGLPAPGTRVFAPGGPHPTIQATDLFPFSGGYAVYAGNCSAAVPTGYVADYWSRYPGLVSTPAGSSVPVTVRVPALNVRVMRSSAAVANAHVVIKATGLGCADQAVTSTDSSGNLKEPGMPFGPYSVCADDGVRAAVVNVTNNNPDGSVATTLSLPTGGTRSVCQ